MTIQRRRIFGKCYDSRHNKNEIKVIKTKMKEKSYQNKNEKKVTGIKTRMK